MDWIFPAFNFVLIVVLIINVIMMRTAIFVCMASIKGLNQRANSDTSDSLYTDVELLSHKVNAIVSAVSDSELHCAGELHDLLQLHAGKLPEREVVVRAAAALERKAKAVGLSLNEMLK